MPTLYDLKPAFQDRLRPAVCALARRGITPNQVTLAALVLSLATGAALAAWPLVVLWLVPVVLLVRMALNAIDGMLAREHAMISRRGAVLNEMGDMLADAAVYLPLALVPGITPALPVLFALLAVLTEAAGVLAQALDGVRRYDGPLGKSDRALLIGALCLLLALGAPVWLADLVLLLALPLLAWTVIQRLRP